MSEQEPDQKGMSPIGKAGAYVGLAFVTPISGWICYKLGQWLDQSWGTGYLYLVGLIVGCAAGMYETYRQAVRIEGLDRGRGNAGLDRGRGNAGLDRGRGNADLDRKK